MEIGAWLGVSDLGIAPAGSPGFPAVPGSYRLKLGPCPGPAEKCYLSGRRQLCFVRCFWRECQFGDGYRVEFR